MKKSCILIFLFGFFLRFHLLSIMPVWMDERTTIQILQSDVKTIVLGVFDPARPPLYYLLLKIWFLISANPHWLRLCSLICYVFNYILFYKIGKKYTVEIFGIFLATNYALSGYFINFDWQLRPYAFLLTSVLATSYIIFDSRVRFRLLFLVTLMGLFLDFGYLYFLGSVLVFFGYHWVRYLKAEDEKRLVAVCVAIILFLFYIPVFIHNYAYFSGMISWIKNYQMLSFTIPFLFGLSGISIATYFTIAIWVFGVLRVIKSQGMRSIEYFFIYAGLSAYTTAAIISFFVTPIIHVRSLQIVALCFLFGMSFGLYDLYKKGGWWRMLSYGVMGLLFINSVRVVLLTSVQPGIFLISFL